MSEQAQTKKSNTKRPWYKKWWGLILLLFIWPISVTYLVWKNDKWSKRNKIIGLSIFWITIIALSQFSETSTVDTTSTVQTSSADTAVTPEATPSSEETAQKNQELVLSFEQELYATEKNASQAIQSFKDASANFATSNTTTFDLYQLAKKAKEESKAAQVAYSRMSVSKELPKDVRKQLEDARSDMSTSYFTKGEALDLAMQYLDEGKPSLLSEYSEEMSLADQFTMNAVTKLFKAKEMVGLQIVDTNTQE